jgi:hypothetical protein
MSCGSHPPSPSCPSRGGPPAAPPDELTPQERQLRAGMVFWVGSFAMEIVLYLWWAWSGPVDSRAFAVNSVAKDLTFLVLGLLVIIDVRRFGRLMTLLVIGHAAIAVTLLVLIVHGGGFPDFPNTPKPLLGIHLVDGGGWQLPVWCVLAAGATVSLFILHMRARRSRYGLEFLHPLQYETLVALAATVLDEPRVSPEVIATAVDRHWGSFNGRETRLVRTSLTVLSVWPLLPPTFRAPFALMSPRGRRDFIERRFLRDGIVLASLARPAIRFCIQMVHMGYYSRPETNADTGYEPFSKRPNRPPPPPKQHCPLQTIAPERVQPDTLEAEIVIVGSGAAAGVLAHVLTDRGHDVLLLERGDFVDPATFTENELEMYSRLYSDGAVQLSRDFSFQILQGRCVGGGTVVNNAVCFEPPHEVLRAWNDGGAGLPETLDTSLQAVRDLMRIKSQGCAPRSPGVDAVTAAVTALGLDRPPYKSGPVDANVSGCVGCGYCNMGCAYGKKLSMLDRVLPEAQADTDARRKRDRNFKGELRVLPVCEVTCVDREGLHRVKGVHCRVGSERRRMRVKAGTVVVAGGAIASSRLLQRSMIGGLKVGQGLCANIATFMTGDFEGDPMRGFDGLQIASYVAPPQQRGFVLETWFDPPVITSLSMPGWLERHQRNMERYSNIMCVGLLVGTDPHPLNRVKRYPIVRSDFAFRPSKSERTRVAAALRQAGEVLFEAGATRVMAPTFRYREFCCAGAIRRCRPRTRRAATRSTRAAVMGSSTRPSACMATRTSTSATRASSRRRSR